MGEQNRCRKAKRLKASHFVARIIYLDYGTKVDREETREEVLPKMESASPLCVRIHSGLRAHLSFQQYNCIISDTSAHCRKNHEKHIFSNMRMYVHTYKTVRFLIALSPAEVVYRCNRLCNQVGKLQCSDSYGPPNNTVLDCPRSASGKEDFP